MVEEAFSSLQYPEDLVAIIRNGLPKSCPTRRVIIIGGGLSGLVSASLLKRAGHHVTILEGNNRIGGRVYTIRKPFSKNKYMDVGAMRIPNNHALVLEYIRQFGLPINKFLNSSPNDLIFVNNVLTTRKDYEENPDILGFPVDEDEKGKTATELFLEATKPFIDLYENSSDEEKEALVKEYGDYSMGEFLSENPLGRPLSLNAIRSIAVMLGIEGFPNFSFTDILTDIIYPIFGEEIEFYEIKGGNDRLPYSFLSKLQSDIHLNRKVEKIVQSENGVLVQAENPLNGQRFTYSGDAAIVTVPFPVFQFIDVYPYDSISFKKWQAIRELINVPAVKIGIEFSRRFWEEDDVGNALSDLPTRFSYVPSHNIGSSESGVLLASYSWGNDAVLWGSLPEKERIQMVLKDLAKIYGSKVYSAYKTSLSFNWTENPYSAGCFTLFTPGQEENLGEIIRQPEGKLHFAGEHTSSFHGWMEGAIQSGIRAAYEVNESC
ncbi:flavin monoamine oxidase family protein [Guptibacillus algicola]|uniref:flavin monoamine oxidase family protein n=1 Tax=Guptibacillus algicola TaxID=225844 RepID=UPI001CD763CC|nr:flavin monoamine oxidase family protein [Alkalihalobacillus algicola]MCA0987168.1 flavin monoamine oxidase family protein [Alkalihalobacillus algicola]